jgi:hypothetical protein
MKTVRELSDEYGIDRSTLLKAAQRGVFGDAAKRSGATWLIDETSSDFMKWLNSRKRKSPAALA